jgi:ferrochelatase
MTGPARRVAVVLFNLGGPAGPLEVKPFLRRLFADPAIIDLPAAARLPLAALIAGARARKATANYAVMGGGSPLLAGTRAQAEALEATLNHRLKGASVKVFIAMRYSAPFTAEAAAAVARFAPDQVVLAPLYPQFSTTTTASSLLAWKKAYLGSGEVHTLCCWYDNAGLVEAHTQAILKLWNGAGRPKVRLLFSAHGVPVRTAEGGDPYPWQIEAMCAAVARRLGEGWDWRVCYQSRVGPMKWLGPSTPEAIAAAARDGVGVLIDPVSFVSEHIETLVELDRDYALLAAKAGIACYLRAPTVGVAPAFIDGVAGAVERALMHPGTYPDGAACPAAYSRCAMRLEETAR